MLENLVSRDGFSRPVPRQPAHLHTQAESGAYLRDSSRVPRRHPFMKPPYAMGSVPSLSGHAIIAYRWRSLPRARRHRASKLQGSSERVLPWQITTDQFIFASLSHTHYWYEVGMLKAIGRFRCVQIFFKRVKRRIAAPNGSSVRFIVSGYPRLWLRGGIKIDCGLVPSNGLTMSGVFLFNFSTETCRYIPLHLLLI